VPLAYQPAVARALLQAEAEGAVSALLDLSQRVIDDQTKTVERSLKAAIALRLKIGSS